MGVTKSAEERMVEAATRDASPCVSTVKKELGCVARIRRPTYQNSSTVACGSQNDGSIDPNCPLDVHHQTHTSTGRIRWKNGAGDSYWDREGCAVWCCGDFLGLGACLPTEVNPSRHSPRIDANDQPLVGWCYGHMQWISL